MSLNISCHSSDCLKMMLERSQAHDRYVCSQSSNWPVEMKPHSNSHDFQPHRSCHGRHCWQASLACSGLDRSPHYRLESQPSNMLDSKNGCLALVYLSLRLAATSCRYSPGSGIHLHLMTHSCWLADLTWSSGLTRLWPAAEIAVPFTTQVW